MAKRKIPGHMRRDIPIYSGREALGLSGKKALIMAHSMKNPQKEEDLGLKGVIRP